MPRKTYIDSCVLLAAFKGDEPTSQRAMDIIGDTDRTFVVSHVLALECVSTARRGGYTDQVEFCEDFIRSGEHVALGDASTSWAVGVLAGNYIQPMDLFHIAIAVQAQADDFITTEAPTKPFFTIGAPLNVVSIL